MGNWLARLRQPDLRLSVGVVSPQNLFRLVARHASTAQPDWKRSLTYLTKRLACLVNNSPALRAFMSPQVSATGDSR